MGREDCAGNGEDESKDEDVFGRRNLTAAGDGCGGSEVMIGPSITRLICCGEDSSSSASSVSMNDSSFWGVCLSSLGSSSVCFVCGFRTSVETDGETPDSTEGQTDDMIDSKRLR